MSQQNSDSETPVGFLTWPGLTFVANGVLERVGPASCVGGRIPLYAHPSDLERRLREAERERDDVRRALDGQIALLAEIIADRDEALRLLKRYRTETPLGHQPHMIAHEADAAIAAKEVV